MSVQPTPVITSTIDVELPEWLIVPPVVDEEWRAAVRGVLDTITEVERNLPEDSRLFEDGLVVDSAAAVEHLVTMAGELDEGDRLVASFVVPNRWPLPVVVSVGAADPGADLLDLAGATTGLPVDRPAVDELPPEVGGEGPVVTRFDLDDTGAVIATVCAVRRDAGIDTRVLWRSSDLAVVPLFTPAIIQLVGAVRNGNAADEDQADADQADENQTDAVSA